MNTNLKHDDCRNLATVDVAKGYCYCHKRMVIIDTPVCERFDALPKCGICAHFVGDKEEKNIGICSAEKNHPWTYPDLITTTCELYKNK